MDSTKYAIKLNPDNLKVHLDIESDIQRIKNGLFNIVIKVNRELIIDYVVYENLSTCNTELTIAPAN